MDGQPLFNVFTSKPAVKQREENIQAMTDEIDKVCLFPPSVQENRGLLNAFNQAKATPEQSFDMLNFRDIGSHDLENLINHFCSNSPVQQHL